MRVVKTILSMTFACAAVCGCASAPAPIANRGQTGLPTALQLQRRDDSLQGQRYRTLLNFETPDDAVFVHAAGLIRSAAEAHTGKGAIEIEAREATIAIDALLFGTKLPGDWTLLGAYVQPPVDVGITAELFDAADGKTITHVSRRCAGGQWNLLALDLANPTTATAVSTAREPRLRVSWEPIVAGVRIDDALLIDNTRTLIDTTNEPMGWSVRRRGYLTQFSAPGRFTFSVTAAAADERGWVIDEVNNIRAVLRSGGPVYDWVIYADGRTYRDGTFEALGAAISDARQSHDHPATIEVDEAGGRVERSTAGDANNDGYNERRGAYQLRADSGRLHVRLSPQGWSIDAPVLEIAHLPAGTVQVMVEGRLVNQVTRIADGRALVYLPVHIEKPMTVTIKVLANNATPGGPSATR